MLETQTIEQYLMKTGEGADRLVFEARTLLEPELSVRVEDQKIAHKYIREYNRRKLREEIAEVDQRMFRDTGYRGFRQKILSYFK